MMQLPDNIRRPLELLARYHFWLLAAVVPLILLPLYFSANWHLDAEMQSARRQIEDRLNGLKAVEDIQPHPNENWTAEINAATAGIKRETFKEWNRFWESEAELRVWPASLGDDFVQRATALKPDGKLSRKLLERYQNGVRELVRGLPGRMGADEAMIEKSAEGPAAPAPARASTALVVWEESDQRRIFASFNWEKPPSTPQVVLAQEELWVYGLFCDVIARVNEPAAGRYNAPIPFVQQLSVGYLAAEESPGGMGTGRIKRPAAPAGGQPSMGGAPLESAPEPTAPVAPVAPAVRPAHPRFPGIGSAAAPPPAGGDGSVPGAASPDDALRNWIYVDFEGRPQDSAALATAVESQMVHLMPFMTRIVVDQRKLDTLLVALATAEWPIDVRQIRINAVGGAAVQGSGGNAPAAAMPAAQAASGQSGRPYDILVELRGTVCLATPPNETVIGLEPAAPAAEPAAGEAAGPPDAGADSGPPTESAPPAEPPGNEAAAPAPAAEAAPPAGQLPAGQPPAEQPPPQEQPPTQPPPQEPPPAQPPSAAGAADRHTSRVEEARA
jgi:hypothetical protein